MSLLPGLPDWVRVRDKDTGYEYSVRYVQPEAHELLKGEPATDDNGGPLPPVHDTPQALAKATAAEGGPRGQELDDALEAAGLSKSGKVEDKQARLAEHQLTSGQEG